MLATTCLIAALYFEARGEGPEGMRAVRAVIENRVDDTRWPDTYCDVIYQPMQFAWTRDGLSDTPKPTQPADIQALKDATEIASETYIMGITSNHFVSGPVVFWEKSLIIDGVVGKHRFYTWE